MMTENSPKALRAAVSERLDTDVEAFPSEIITVYGQKLPVTESTGGWAETLFFEHLGYGSKKISWGKRIHSDDYIEWILRSWILDSLEDTAHLTVFLSVVGELDSLIITDPAPLEVENAVYKWAKKHALKGASIRHSYITAGMRFLYEWCLDEGLPGFSELRQFDLESIRPNWRRSESPVSLRDFDTGPFTRTELALIEAGMRRPGRTSVAEQVLVFLCRDWGLRPIQLNLLRVQDFGRDELGPYIRVPSVKGKIRSRLRRAPSNMVKRYISDDTADAIELQINIARTCTKSNIIEIGKFIGQSNAAKLEIPLFPTENKTEARLKRFCDQPALVNYALHLDSHHISKKIRKLTDILAINSPRSKIHSDASEVLQISAYRFRRTKGTSMVLAGASPEEVAEALDHSGIGSVKYYFRYNLELHDFINTVHASSPEISTAIEMWNGRIDSVTEIALGEIKIGSLGKCTLGSTCPHHPTVTCYSCPNFRPNKSANHQGALESIYEFQRIIASSSTGPIAQQVEIAIYGAKAVIIALNEDTPDV